MLKSSADLPQDRVDQILAAYYARQDESVLKEKVEALFARVNSELDPKQSHIFNPAEEQNASVLVAANWFVAEGLFTTNDGRNFMIGFDRPDFTDLQDHVCSILIQAAVHNRVFDGEGINARFDADSVAVVSAERHLY